jgi:hypothetical protein
MTNRFLISVAAAALIAGTGFANAQGAGGMSREGGAGSSAQQSAPSAGGGAAQSAPQHRESPSGMTTGQSDKAPAGKQADDMKGGKAQPNTASDSDRMGKGGKDMKAEGREGKDKEKGTVGQAPADKSGTTTQGREDKGGAMGRDDRSREDRMGQKGEKGATDPNRAQKDQGTMDRDRAQGTQTQTGSQTTTGMAPAAPPPEKRSQITTAIKSEKFEDVGANVNVNVSVGTRLPSSIRFHPLPPRIVEIYPEWRGYHVVLIKGRYVIVRPETYEIVYIIEG